MATAACPFRAQHGCAAVKLESGQHLACRIRGSEKIPQPGEFNDGLSRKYATYQPGLRRCMNFVQVAHGDRLGNERLNAFVECAVDD